MPQAEGRSRPWRDHRQVEAIDRFFRYRTGVAWRDLPERFGITFDKAALAAFLDWARTRYRRVLFIGSGGTDLLSHRYGVRPLTSERFQVPEYDSPLDAYPRFVRQKEFDYGVYQGWAPANEVTDIREYRV